MSGLTPEYSTLMSSRIRRILLVCSNYDSYTLEEDGNIEAQITREYAELNLSNPPSITRTESTSEALEHLKAGESFDLIISMYNVGSLDVFTFAREVKGICSSTPVVLLSSYSKEIYSRITDRDTSCIDYVFCWNNSTDLIIAIIKLFEDKANAQHDIGMGVQAILLVEDSIRYYSTYLPMLYKTVLQQNNVSIQEALNTRQQRMRKRARPKLLMATSYEEAINLYDKYRDNLLGVITDVGFVVHKGDDPSTEKLDAGVDLVRHIRSITPKMPILMQSSQESMRQTARELSVGFVMKQSKMLSEEISDYMEKEFGFGDFIYKGSDKDTYRIHNLYELEKMATEMSDADLTSISYTNLISKWMKARGLFSLSAAFRGMSLEKDGTIEAHRKTLLDALKDYRINQGLGETAQFDPETYNDAIWFARIGKGSMGGKGRGLAFMNHILQRHDMYDKWEGIRVLVPRTVVITTEYFDRFIKDNGLRYVIQADITDEELLSEFVSASLPPELTEALRKFIQYTDKPLAIRSSSALEDSYYQPFAGVYSTYMIPSSENEDQLLRLLSKAIKSVYASVFYASSRSYITATGNVISEEKMAVIVQEVCGSRDGGLFFPTLSGVARSLNFYPVGHEKPEDGIVKMAMGLGKAVVDGDQVLRYSPKYPKNVLQTSTPEQVMKETQKAIYALDLQPDKFKTSVDDAVNLVRIPVEDCSGFRNMKYVASTLELESGRIVDSAMPEGPKYITFSQMLKYGTFPVSQIITSLLEVARKEIKCQVEIEFAASLDESPVFNVLQIRPISPDMNDERIDWDKIDCKGAAVLSGCALGTGWIKDITDVIYLKPSAWDILKTRDMAAQIKDMNAKMLLDKLQYVLVGFGRWGSSIPSLGIPVQWSDISQAKVLVEASLEDFRTEPSQGTHFFQNLTSFNAGYVSVDPWAGRGDVLDIDSLDALPAIEETEFFRHVRTCEPLLICIDGRSGRALIRKLSN